MIIKGRLSGFQRSQIRWLLDMHYTIKELALEIGISKRLFSRVYFPLGCPVIRDRGRVFIHGKAFAEWYEATYPVSTIGADQGFCLTCKKGVSMVDPITKKKGRLVYKVFKCPHCTRKISRIVEKVKQ